MKPTSPTSGEQQALSTHQICVLSFHCVHKQAGHTEMAGEPDLASAVGQTQIEGACLPNVYILAL